MIVGSHWMLVVDFAAFGFRPRKVKSEKMKGPVGLRDIMNHPPG